MVLTDEIGEYNDWPMCKVDFGQSNVTGAISWWDQIFDKKPIISVVVGCWWLNTIGSLFIREDFLPVAQFENTGTICWLGQVHFDEIDRTVDDRLDRRVVVDKCLVTINQTSSSSLFDKLLNDFDYYNSSIGFFKSKRG